MTAKLFAEMINLENHVRPFPIINYKVSTFFSNKDSTFENNYNHRTYKKQHHYSKKSRQTNILEFFK
jgi:hypothetical protein